jgi:nitrate/TMAO reductase-like tetraheme cytochrome c subunit
MLNVFLIIAAAAALVLVVRPRIALGTMGRAFAFLVLFLFPVTAGVVGLKAQVEHAKRTEFCVSCHVMELHGRSLLIDDTSLLVAAHYQGGRVPRETACFTCHTTYTMFGDFRAKLEGLHHMYVNYIKGPPPETAIRLYKPYNNRECLHCHTGTRLFEENKIHRLEPGRIEKIRNNELSCVSSGCHSIVHDVGDLGDTPDWKPPNDSPGAKK